ALLRSIKLEQLTDEELSEHISKAKQFCSRAVYIHIRLVYPFAVAVGEFAATCRELFGWDEGRSLLLLQGCSRMSLEPSQRLSDLVSMARKRPEIVALLRRPDEENLARIRMVDKDFGEAIERYMYEFGFRTVQYEVMEK